MTSWYPMDGFMPGDGDGSLYDEEPEPVDDLADGAEVDEPHDDDACTGDEDCECPCHECQRAVESLHRL